MIKKIIDRSILVVAFLIACFADTYLQGTVSAMVCDLIRIISVMACVMAAFYIGIAFAEEHPDVY